MRVLAALFATPVPPAVLGNVPVVKALVDVAYKAPPEVNDVRFVPPLAVASVPATVTAPVDAVLGVNPVVPNVIEATPLADAVDHCGAVPPPFTVKTCPAVPIPSFVNDVPEA